MREFWETAPAAAERFDPARLRDLPQPARRYLEHAIAPGTPLAWAVRLRMHGEIKLGRWRPFTAEQVIRRDRGMIWQASTRLLGLPVRGFDRIVDGAGVMRWKMLGLVPVATGDGPDVTRSALGRLRGESFWLPSMLCDDTVAWTAAGPTTALATFAGDGERTVLELFVDDNGGLKSLKLRRWGNPGRGEHRYEDFGGVMEAERTFGGFTVPSRLRAGWRFGSKRFESEGEFFRVTIEEAEYR